MCNLVIYYHNVYLVDIHFLLLSIKSHIASAWIGAASGMLWLMFSTQLGCIHELPQHVFFFFFLKAQSSFNFASLSANLSHQHVWLWMLWARRHLFELGMKDLIMNTDLALEQSGCGGDSGAAHEVGGAKAFFQQVWWYASLKMTTCKNCLEDPIKYVWNYIFKGHIDREIHHPIVKCRNTISAWILSNTLHWNRTECNRRGKATNATLILHVTFIQRYFFLSCFWMH